MKIFIVSYVWASGEERYVSSHFSAFADEETAREKYKEERLNAIRIVREEFEDVNEETRDVSIRDYARRCVVLCHDDGEMAEVKLSIIEIEQP